MSESKIVPREPTEAMLEQGRNYREKGVPVRVIWRAMYDAAPSAATPAPEPTDAEISARFRLEFEPGPNPYYLCNVCNKSIPGLRDLLTDHVRECAAPAASDAPAPAVSAPDARLSAPAGEDAPTDRECLLYGARWKALAQQRGERLEQAARALNAAAANFAAHSLSGLAMQCDAAARAALNPATDKDASG